MIDVLGSWDQIGDSVRLLREQDLPLHRAPEKNWDLALLVEACRGLDKAARIVDLGCAEYFALELLARLGFTNLTGLDLNIPLADRLRLLVDSAKRRSKPPFRLHSRDLTQTGLGSKSVDLLTCLSVIEHDVPLERFAREAIRVLRPGGRLLVTTDYWPRRPQQRFHSFYGPRPYNIGWRIMTDIDVDALLLALTSVGFQTDSPQWAAPEKPVVSWNGYDYTFLCLSLQSPD